MRKIIVHTAEILLSGHPAKKLTSKTIVSTTLQIKHLTRAPFLEDWLCLGKHQSEVSETRW